MYSPKQYETSGAIAQEPRLTRYLYIYDEVLYALLTELLMRKNLHACYYLISELYYTDTDIIFDLLWKIYFDFYAEHHPSLETCIANKHRAWCISHDIKPVIFVIKNMFMLQGSSTVFHLRQFVENGGKCMCLYRLQEKTLVKRGWKEYPKLICRLFIALERRHIQNAGCYLYKLLAEYSSDEIYFMLMDYFSKSVSLKNMSAIRKNWDRRMWYDDGHMLLAFMVSMSTPCENIARRLTFKPPNEADLNFVNDISSVDDILPYRVLREKRRTVIVPEINAFRLVRSHVIHCAEKVRDNWEYYAFHSAIWKPRFARFGGYIDGDKVKFTSEENEARFYALYGLEPDEQSLDVQHAGHVYCDYNDQQDKFVCWRDWHEIVFQREPRIVLHSTYKYQW